EQLVVGQGTAAGGNEEVNVRASPRGGRGRRGGFIGRRRLARCRVAGHQEASYRTKQVRDSTLHHTRWKAIPARDRTTFPHRGHSPSISRHSSRRIPMSTRSSYAPLLQTCARCRPSSTKPQTR